MLGRIKVQNDYSIQWRNGKLLVVHVSGKLTKADIDGSELPQYRMGARILGDSEYLLMSDVNPNSFDARYFGLILGLQIQHVVELFFTWGK